MLFEYVKRRGAQTKLVSGADVSKALAQANPTNSALSNDAESMRTSSPTELQKLRAAGEAAA
jgi:hypothetical protein